MRLDGHEERVADGGRGARRDAHLVRRGASTTTGRSATASCCTGSVIESGYDQKKHDFKEELHTAFGVRRRRRWRSWPGESGAEYHDEFDGRDLQVEILREEPFDSLPAELDEARRLRGLEGRALRIGLADAQVSGSGRDCRWRRPSPQI